MRNLNLVRVIVNEIPCRRFEIEGEAFMIAPHDDEEPKNVNEARSGPKAMEEEMDSMNTNQVWDLVDLPLGRRTIGNKWILKIKCKADGSIEKYKAWLTNYISLPHASHSRTYGLRIIPNGCKN